MQDYSIGEVDSLVLKAYRGAGFSWGLAQEAGNAAAWMAVNGLPALDEFAQLLQSIDRQVTGTLTPLISDKTCWSNPSGQLCPVITGVTFSESELDRFDFDQGLIVNSVHQPMILIPFIAHSAKLLQRDLVLQIKDEKIICAKEGNGLYHHQARHQGDPLTSDISISQTVENVSADVEVCQRAQAAPQSLDVLNELAHRTYVPATEESRQGAGAGLLDND